MSVTLQLIHLPHGYRSHTSDSQSIFISYLTYKFPHQGNAFNHYFLTEPLPAEAGRLGEVS